MMNIRKKAEGINNVAIIAVVAALVVGGLAYKFLGCEGGDGAGLYKSSPVVAHVNGTAVYQLEVDAVVKAVIPPNDGKQVSYADLDEKSKTMIVREVAAQRVMLDEAKSKGIKADDEIKRKVYEYKNKLVRDQLLSKFANTEVTQEKMLVKYGEIEKAIKGKAQIKVSHILVNSEEDAQSAEDRLKKEPFAKVAKDVSQDSSNKDKGGDLGYLLAGTMDPDFEKAALALKVGEVSVPVKTKFGWHIIKIEDRKIAIVPAFEALKGRIAQDTYNESLKKYADDLLANIKIELVKAEEKKDEKAAQEEKPEEKKSEKKTEVKKGDKEEGKSK